MADLSKENARLKRALRLAVERFYNSYCEFETLQGARCEYFCPLAAENDCTFSNGEPENCVEAMVNYFLQEAD